MINSILFPFFQKLFGKYKKYGFTLAEALIITVMTGACLLPILGTMQNAQVRTENYDHQSKMQMFARSRLNAEIANAAFDHKSINTENEYHYIVYFASSTSNEPAEVDDAKLIELPKTYVTLNELASLTVEAERENWATAAVNLLGISRDKGTPYLDVVHAYKTSVESKNSPSLAEFGNDSNIIDSPKALLDIVVKTCLLKSNGQDYWEDDGSLKIETDDGSGNKTYAKDPEVQVLPVTLFSFVNLPTVSDEMIWIADALNCVIYGIDPLSRGVTTITLPRSSDKSDAPEHNKNDPYRPWHIAIHPSLKIMAVMMQEKVVLINIDKKSPYFSDIKDTTIIKTDLNNKNICNIDKEFNRAYEDGGLCFRPDGKVLFLTQTVDKGSSKIYAFEFKFNINPETMVLNWEKGTNNTPYFTNFSFTSSVSCSLLDDKIVGLKPSNDGYLYLAYKEIDPKENNFGKIYRYPMYQSDWSEWKAEEFTSLAGKKISSIDVSPDGKRLAVITEPEGLLIEYDTKTKAGLYDPLTIKNADNKIPNPFKNAYVSIADNQTNLYESKSLNVAVSSRTEINKALVGNFESNTSDPFRKAKVEGGTEGGFIVVSPDSKYIIANDKKKPRLYFWNSETTSSTDLLTIANNGINEFIFDNNSSGPKSEKGFSDLATNKRDTLAATFEDNKIKLFDLNTFKELEDESFSVTNSVSGLAMNSLGNILLSSHGDNTTGSYMFNNTDLSSKYADNNYLKNTRKTVFDDSFPNMAFALQYNISGSDNSVGIYNFYNEDYNKWETSSIDSYDRRNYLINSDWQGLDIIGMPNGGAMVLYGKTDGSSMIEWVGRRNWGTTNVGKYKLFARWTNIYKPSVTDSYLPNNSSLSVYTRTEGDNGHISRLESALEPNTVVNSFDFKAADGLNFNDTSTRFITPIVLKKVTSGKFKVVNYATNKISSTKGQDHPNVPITWKYPFNINQPNTYYLGWWNGHLTGNNQGVVGYESEDDSNGNFLSDVGGWFSPNNTILDLISLEIDDNSTHKRNYSIKFKITHVQPKETNFPPLGSKKLAINPECSILSILATDTSDAPVVNLYDFNNQIYGPETQIEGMLVDYRTRLDSGEGSSSLNPETKTPWPEETSSKSIFTTVATKCHFGDSINTFGGATTKNDSWTSFNEHPANYYFSNGDGPSNSGDINTYKSIANKRFFGYFRPEYKTVNFQSAATEDVRYFYNDSYIYGRNPKNVSGLTFIPNSIVPSINCYAYDSGKLQIDQGSDAGGMFLGSFISDETATVILSDVTNHISKKGSTATTNYYEPTLDGWNFLKSEQTYILKNHPIFMSSYKIQSSTAGSELALDQGNMLFSRDKAKPVLYIKDTNRLWALYNNKVIRVDVGADLLFDFALSTDGQKLIYTNTASSKNYISAFNVSSPNDTLFTGSADELSLSSDTNTYLGRIASISLDLNSKYLATKPFVSYKSTKVGGKYRLLNDLSTFTVAANGAVATGGGIYLLRADQDKIALFKPLDNSFSVYGKSIKKMYSSVVTAYDDTLYIFGSAGNGSDDSVGGRVQSYNVNTKKALTSLNEAEADTGTYSNSYQVNMGIKGDCSNFNGSISDYISGNCVNDAQNIFIYDPVKYVKTNSEGPYIDIKFNSPLTVNKILISNYNPSTNCNDKNIKKYFLKGANASSFENISSIDLSTSEDHAIDITSSRKVQTFGEKCYKTYRLYLTHVWGNIPTPINPSNYEWCECSKLYDLVFSNPKYDGIVNTVMLFREGVKRITPEVGDSDMSTYSSSFNTKTDDFTWKTTNIRNSDSQDQCDLKDVYIPSKPESNKIEYNVFTEKSQGWDTAKPNPCIVVSLTNREAVCAVRYANSNKSNSNEDRKTLKMFKLFGTNVDGSYYPSNFDGDDSTPDPNIWKPIIFTNNSDFFIGPNVNDTFITAEVKAPQKYKYYLFKVYDKYGSSGDMRMIGFEMFSSREKDELPTQDYLTPMKNDDLGQIKVSSGAVCATPYGLVYTGGFNKLNIATQTSLLYWPHAINKYDGYYNQFGISRSLPEMKCPRANHALVWHKGKIYALGGRSGLNDDDVYNNASFTEVLDYNNKMEWELYSKNYIYVDGADDSYIAKRYNHGACSFGDEIFMFGGLEESDYIRSSAIAFNPETGVVRRLSGLGDVLASNEKLDPCVAVPFGSKIYIFGMGNGNLKILEYTP